MKIQDWVNEVSLNIIHSILSITDEKNTSIKSQMDHFTQCELGKYMSVARFCLFIEYQTVSLATC